MKKLLRCLKPCCAALALVLLFAFPALADWAYETGIPTTQQLRAVWGYSDTKILAAGNAGTILLYDGSQWQDIPGITSKNIFGVWWASANEAFAACDSGVLLHYDGTTWKAMNSGTIQRLREVWGASATDVFAVGENGTILHYDGNVWKTMPCPTPLTLQSVWGTSGKDVYAVGGTSGSGGTGNGVIIHYDGKLWATMSDPSIPRLQDVFGFKGKMIFAVGESGTVFSLASGSSAWQSMSSGTLNTLRDIWGSAATNAYAVGDAGTIVHYDGVAWSQVYPVAPTDLFGVWGSSAGNIWAVGRNGVIMHYTDTGTDNTTSPCPFTTAVTNDDDLRLLRSARDSRLGTLSGMCLTALFYATAPETARIARHDPALKNKIAELVADNRPLLQELAGGISGHISGSSLQDISAFLKELQAAGSPRLALVLGGARHGLEHGWLLRLLDITVE